MIKAKTTDRDGYPVFIFGLSDGNLELLRQGRPIAVDLRELGARGSVVIMWGATEEAIQAEMGKHFSFRNIRNEKEPNG